ncbi:hypothetical protein GCM10022409_18290 [Hymenobacter glaciei]|uniref:Uncharacterized protein n=2 Tax=Hymenobacter glaciei TaxID=877209 RepID=A0ABP7U171_9BACT
MQEHAIPAAAHLSSAPLARAEVAVPTLLGLSVDELARHLGPPQPMPVSVKAVLEQFPIADTADSTRYFRYQHLSLLASYDNATRHLNDLVLLGTNEDLLMQQAGLAVEAANYLVLPVFQAHRPTQLLGLRVVPLDPTQLQ